ncbi:hypothetical protein [Vibrio sp. HN007]|uniref:hypothetical protein n=1 Tax=Vibrio iocasae TaxID=3098914 RepID=UPI0035D5097B
MFKKSIVMLLSLVVSLTTLACPLHFGFDGFEQETIPGADKMKFATIFYSKHGDIEEPTTLPPGPTFQRASWWLSLLANNLKDPAFESAYIILIDIPLWSRVDPESARGISIDIQPPEALSKVILMTQASLSAVVEKRISISEAIEKGLVSFHEAETNTREAFTNLLID